MVTGDQVEGPHYSISEELKALAITGAALDRLGLMGPDAKSAIKACQGEQRLLRQNALRQTTIADHFKPQ